MWILSWNSEILDEKQASIVFNNNETIILSWLYNHINITIKNKWLSIWNKQNSKLNWWPGYDNSVESNYSLNTKELNNKVVCLKYNQDQSDHRISYNHNLDSIIKEILIKFLKHTEPYHSKMLLLSCIRIHNHNNVKKKKKNHVRN